MYLDQNFSLCERLILQTFQFRTDLDNHEKDRDDVS